MWIRGSGSTITERWIRGSGYTFPKCGSQDPDPDPRQHEMDPKRCPKEAHVYLKVKIKTDYFITGAQVIQKILPHNLLGLACWTGNDFGEFCKKHQV